MARSGQRATGQAVDPLNIRPKAARLEVRRQFFSQSGRKLERDTRKSEECRDSDWLQGWAEEASTRQDGYCTVRKNQTV
jgi:hypothetical protein